MNDTEHVCCEHADEARAMNADLAGALRGSGCAYGGYAGCSERDPLVQTEIDKNMGRKWCLRCAALALYDSQAERV